MYGIKESHNAHGIERYTAQRWVDALLVERDIRSAGEHRALERGVWENISPEALWWVAADTTRRHGERFAALDDLLSWAFDTENFDRRASMLGLRIEQDDAERTEWNGSWWDRVSSWNSMLESEARRRRQAPAING